MVPRSPLGSVRRAASIGASKAALAALRRTGRGGGTAAPGLLALQIDPEVVSRIAERLSDGAVVVAGTNGKTTTSRMIADIIEASGRTVIHNRSGSNLARGVAATFIEHASLSGEPDAQMAVIESDEAALPEILRLVKPRLVVLNNLFRDQLDRYGELNTVGTRWKAAFGRLPPTTCLLVDVDDPTLATITAGLDAPRTTFGLRIPEHTLDELPHAADAAICRKCGADLTYRELYLGHLGDWLCTSCGYQRPALDVTGSAVRLDGMASLTMSVEGNGQAIRDVTVHVPGIYNAYNVTAAVAAAFALRIDPATIRSALENFRSPFGRAERVRWQGREISIALVKNPVGFNEVLRTITGGGSELAAPTLIVINDEFADGRDVSWLWDVDFEMLAAGTLPIATAGMRGADMANRLKYAGVEESRLMPLDGPIDQALTTFLQRTSDSKDVSILPTYTAMLAVREILGNAGAVERFWEE
ncbi:MAG TPA: MurT ligase domain-containing protein [Thermomicrobiales bacterium]|nr:MurT ligase domain-containing protein [Thermomicrobiales bacterium]